MKKVLFILGELLDRDIDWIVAIGTRQTVAPTTTLIQEGQAVDTLYILLDGALSISTEATKGRIIARLTRGEVVGEMSFVDSRPPSATVRAAETSQVFAIPLAELTAKLTGDVEFAARFYRALAMFLSDRLRSTVEQLGGRPEISTETNAPTLESQRAAEARLDSLLSRLREK